ncbi:hypothetical protein C2E20_5962 [Micractinium conductrix]|uniref:RNA polymerase II subunit B1 CTD phosphatase RPAP2 homolog n=1 Tax=Micractinium conductrix TaxID=554055 RepID=A0A2P6V8U7_9CHLO|nr:hypothetical protein C2E20_5962 [Micractinium conductrix]|eukprot:PSC70503.1 hypothetical protein C2E20_5962 [Micractinium conductrix]
MAAPPTSAARRSPAAARRKQLTLPELRSKAAFRACDRLMEHGAQNETQLWALARVMSGEEYEQAAEERAIAGKCGNPLCGHAPAPAPAPPGGRFRTSTSQQSVFEHPDEEAPVFCGADCAAAVRRFAQRLGSGALALDRFCALYEQAQAEKPAQPPAAPAQQQPAEPAAAQQAAAQHSAAAAAGVQAPAAVQPASSGAGGAGRDGAGPPATDTCPGGIKSSTTLVPRLAVEQVEVKLIDSSAGQFADFSRNTWQAPPWQAPAARPAAPPLTRAAPRQPKPQPRGVLKKQSQFAAGTAKVPIMLAEVKERDASMVAAETARGLTAEGASGSRGGKAAAAVEGYVPRAAAAQQKEAARQQRQRRVRWSDDVEEAEEQRAQERRDEQQQPELQAQAQPPPQQPEPQAQAQPPQQQRQQQQQPARAQQVAAAPPPAPQTQPQQQEHPLGQPQPVQQAQAAGGRPAPSPSPLEVAAESAAVLPPGSSSIIVFDVEEPRSPLDATQAGLEARFGRLRVMDSLELAGAAATAAAAVRAAGAPAASPAAPAAALVRTAAAAVSPARPAASSSGIDIQRQGPGAGRAGTWALPPEWREAPQFYAHSPVGTSSNLAGSLTSPGGSNSNLSALAAAACSPPRSRGPARIGPGPPGLPRPPASGAMATQRSLSPAAAERPASGAGRGSAASAGSMQQLPNGQAPAKQAHEPPALTRRQAEQLQRAFPPLSAVLPPELQAALASDSETESEAAESEDWMCSDDDEEGEGMAGSDDEGGALPNGRRSGFRIQLSFFGMLFTHLEAWVTAESVQLLASPPSAELVPPAPPSPEVLATLGRFLAMALPPVLEALQCVAPRSEVERVVHELLRSMRVVGPLPAFKATQWQVVIVLLLKALSLERCPPLRPSFETREGIGRVNRLLASLSFTSEEFYAALELLCPVA